MSMNYELAMYYVHNSLRVTRNIVERLGIIIGFGHKPFSYDNIK